MATNKEVIEAAYATFAKGDVPAVLAVMDPKIEWTEAEGFPLSTAVSGSLPIDLGTARRNESRRQVSRICAGPCPPSRDPRAGGSGPGP
jgi:ketosteroid isomerase-like protein